MLISIWILSCGLTMFKNDKLDFSIFQFLKTLAYPACEDSNSLIYETLRFFDFFDASSRQSSFIIHLRYFFYVLAFSY